MRLAVAFCLTFAAVIVESRPSTLPTDVSKLNVEQSIDNAVEARGLGDVLHNALNQHSSDSNGTTTTRSDTPTTTPVTTSPSSASATSSASSSATLKQTPSSSSSATSSTTSPSSSVNSPSSSRLSLGSLLGGGLKNQGSEDTTPETYGNDKITTYHSLGTSGDRVGFSWVPVDSSD